MIFTTQLFMTPRGLCAPYIIGKDARPLFALEVYYEHMTGRFNGENLHFQVLAEGVRILEPKDIENEPIA